MTTREQMKNTREYVKDNKRGCEKHKRHVKSTGKHVKDNKRACEETWENVVVLDNYYMVGGGVNQ